MINNFQKINKLFAVIVLSQAIFGSLAVPFTANAQNLNDPDKGLIPCGMDDTNKDGMIKNTVNDQGVVITKEECDFTDIYKLIINVTNYLIILGAAISAIAFAWAGFLMMTSGGEAGKIEHAKAIFSKVVVGFLLMLSAWLIVAAINSMVAPNFLNNTDLQLLK